MANIKQYENPIDGLRPTEVGIAAALQGASRAGRFFNEMAEATSKVGNQLAHGVEGAVKAIGNVALDYAQHQEISHGAAAYAGLNSALTKKWNETVKAADPNDPTVADKFRQDVLEPELEKFGGSFLTAGGQKWGEHRVEALRNHLFEKTTADMGSLAAAAVHKNTRLLENNLSNTATQDPSSVPHLLESVDASIGAIVDSSSYLKGPVGSKAKVELTERMKERIVKSGAMSAIQLSPNPEATAERWTQEYPDYINGADALTLARTARTQIRFNEAQDKAARLAQKQADTLDADRAGAKLVASVIREDGTVDPTKKPELMTALRKMIMPGNTDANGKSMYLPGMTTGKALELFKFANGEDIVRESNPTVKSDLQAQVVTGRLDPIDIIKAVNDKQLSHADAGILEGQRKLIEEHPVNAKGLQVVFEGAKAALVIPTNYSDFMQEFLPQYLKAKADGTLKMGDLNFSDPNSMVSKALAEHQPDNATKMQYKIMQVIGQGIGNIEEQTKQLNAPKIPPTMSKAEVFSKYAGQWVNIEGNLQLIPKQK